MNKHKQTWFKNLDAAFGGNGVLTLSWYVGSLFADKIRAKHGSFPALEVSGLQQSGKTTLLEFMNKAVYMEEIEEINAIATSITALHRKFETAGARPVLLLGNGARINHLNIGFGSNGVASGATVVIIYDVANVNDINAVANVNDINAVANSVNIELSCADHTEASKIAADALINMSKSEMESFISLVKSKESEILEKIDVFLAAYHSEVFDFSAINDTSIKHNLMLSALAAYLIKLVPMPSEKVESIQIILNKNIQDKIMLINKLKAGTLTA